MRANRMQNTLRAYKNARSQEVQCNLHGLRRMVYMPFSNLTKGLFKAPGLLTLWQFMEF